MLSEWSERPVELRTFSHFTGVIVLLIRRAAARLAENCVVDHMTRRRSRH
ncbi:hypothetical protein ACK8GG_15780 [Micromonosporaceae bacterium DT55]